MQIYHDMFASLTFPSSQFCNVIIVIVTITRITKSPLGWIRSFLYTQQTWTLISGINVILKLIIFFCHESRKPTSQSNNNNNNNLNTFPFLERPFLSPSTSRPSLTTSLSPSQGLCCGTRGTGHRRPCDGTGSWDDFFLLGIGNVDD